MKIRLLSIFCVLAIFVFSISSCVIFPRPAQTITDTETESASLSETETQAREETITETIKETSASPVKDKSDPTDPYDASGFVSVSEVIPDVILEIRYYSTYNFVGERIDGYLQPVALLSKEAAEALSKASDELREKGYRIKIFDAYRPQCAVDHFARWASDSSDTRMKEYFYPNIDKSLLFRYGYIAYYSGHSRGSTVDITLFDMNKGKEVDMGGTFDHFGNLSHPGYKDITDEQYQNRMLLRETMVKYGFKPCPTEWWDFTFIDEPYPNTYFTFPVSLESLKSR